jgi:hypothetical protein
MLVEKDKRIYIDLDSEEGNTYVLLGIAKQFCKVQGIDFSEVNDKMISSNYVNLVSVFESYFGNYVQLATDNPQLIKALS